MTDVCTWLLTPLSGPPTHLVSAAASWHGRLLVLCWGVRRMAATHQQE